MAGCPAEPKQEGALAAQAATGVAIDIERRSRGSRLTRNSIWSARMLRLERIRCSTQLGRYGTASSGMLTSCWVRLLFFRLHARQALTTFSHSSVPRLEIGSTWS